jgi:hypothetical protein
MAAAVLVLGAIALTVAVEVAGGAGWPEVAGDATAGAALLVAAGLSALRADRRRVGVILGVAGVAWLAGTLDASLAALHRGPLVHALLAYPDGRLRSRVAIVATTAAYVSGAVAELANAEWVTIAVTALVVVAAVHGHGGARIGRPGLTAETAALAGALLLGAAASLRDDAGLEDVALWLYFAAVTLAASAMPARLAWSRGAEAGLPGLVAELGDLEGANALRDRLARAIGDPGLVVGYRLGGDGAYVDAGGRRIALPPARGRTVTEVHEDGDIVAVLIHDSAALEDSSLRKAVASTARLAVANTRLQAEATSRARQVAASRRRLVEAADTERRRLESALRSSAGSTPSPNAWPPIPTSRSRRSPPSSTRHGRTSRAWLGDCIPSRSPKPGWRPLSASSCPPRPCTSRWTSRRRGSLHQWKSPPTSSAPKPWRTRPSMRAAGAWMWRSRRRRTPSESASATTAVEALHPPARDCSGSGTGSRRSAAG